MMYGIGSLPTTFAPRAAEHTPGAKWPLVVALLSDLHVERKRPALARMLNFKAQEALEDLAALRPDWWVINGDICNNGSIDELWEFQRIAGGIPNFLFDQLLVTTGNHEFLGDSERLIPEWKRIFGVKTLYTSRVIDGVHFVLLANELRSDGEDPEYWITHEQVKWFENELSTHPNERTIVFMHEPLEGTLPSRHARKELPGDHREHRLQEILSTNHQVKLWFSAHTHKRLGSTEVAGTKKDGVTYVGMGATCYMPDPTADDAHHYSENDVEFSQCRVLEIYSDQVKVRARDLMAHRWLDDLEIVIKWDEDDASHSVRIDRAGLLLPAGTMPER